MKKFDFKKFVPHLVAVGVFLIVAIIFCKPALESGVILKQSDVSGWQGMSQQAFEYKEQHGRFPLWITNMFSGMPAYQIVLEGAWSPLAIIDKAFQLWLPQPMNFFFLACICFYFLCLCLRIRPYAAILGAVAYAYCSFSPIIITAGHNTQMFALGYAPAVLGAVILIFEKKYFAGFTLATLFTALQIGQGHQQISYYLFIVLAAMTIAYAIRFIRARETTHLLRSVGLLIVAGIVGVAVNALVLLTVYDFSKESKRGGQLVMDGSDKKDAVKDGKTTGLSKEYAFQWSYGKAETFSLMFPGVMGYGTHIAERDGEVYMFPKVNESSASVQYMSEKLSAPEDQVVNFISPELYWGTQPFTNGPIYLGAVICFLFLFGLFYLDNKHKWWILIASVFGILLSWGSNLPGFNYFIFDNFPLYNKFRVPTMALVIPQLLFPVMAVLAINKLLDNDDNTVLKKFKHSLFAMGAVFIFALGFYMTSSFSQEDRKRTIEFNKIYDPQDKEMQSKIGGLNNAIMPLKDNRLYEKLVMNFASDPNAKKTAKEIVSEVRKDRAGFLLSDIIRSFIFVVITAALIFLFLKKKINTTLFLIGITLVASIDLLSFGMKYLNAQSFGNKEDYEAKEFPVSPADQLIKQDPDLNFRVFNMAGGDPFQESKTSYYHKSIGGYHPAKLGIYDDLAAYQLNPGAPNLAVLNMLNTKYVIQQQGNDVGAARNPGALGNVWFVRAVKFVNGPVEEMKALSNFNPKDTAIVDAKYKNLISNITVAESSSSIRMTAFDNDAISYQSNGAGSHAAIFSEIFYKDWNAYIDGKPAEIFKANYVLRGLVIPAGTHKIDFKFEPALFYSGRTISNITTWFLMALLVAFIFFQVRNSRKNSSI
ncbi:MAG: YfhO family protein [Ferruginibacter sp.]